MSRDTYIDPSAIVHPSAEIGHGTMIWNWSKIREGACISGNCNIGQGVYVDINVKIGSYCKIQNNVSVYQGVSIDDDVFIGPNATFTNDMYPRARCDNWNIVPTVVGQGASIGANSTIICGVTLGQYCMVGAGAIVTKDVPPFALVVGQPARVTDYVTKSGRPLNYDVSRSEPPHERLLYV